MDPTIHRCPTAASAAPDAYCPACGQSTRERLPTFAQFMREATGRYVAYDGKFWKTLAALLFRPGFLTREYLAGRRRRYIGPARLFLVSSLVLFATLRFATDRSTSTRPCSSIRRRSRRQESKFPKGCRVRASS